MIIIRLGLIAIVMVSFGDNYNKTAVCKLLQKLHLPTCVFF